MQTMLSPGVYTQEVDLSTYVAVTSQSKSACVAGAAQSGPISTPVVISTVAEFISTFGEPIDASGFAAVSYLEYSNTLTYIRLATTSAASRTLTLAGKDGLDAAVADAIVISAKEKGTLYPEAITATVVAGTTADQFTLTITKGDSTVLVNKMYSCLASADNYIGLETTTPFNFVVSETVLASINVIADAEFSTGANGLPLTDEVVNASLALLDDTETVTMDIFAMPAYNTVSTVATLVNIANDRKDCLILLDPLQGMSPQEAADYIDGEDAENTINKLDNSFIAMYYPWGKVYNKYTNTNVWYPPSVAVLAAMSEQYVSDNPWDAPAGIPRFEIKLFTEMERNLTKANRDTLYESNINPLCNYKGLGLTALGQKTTQRSNTATNRINVRFLTNYVKKIAEFSTIPYLFMNIDDNTMSSWLQEFGKIMDSIKTRGGVYDYKLTMDETTVTQEMIDNNTMPGIIQIKPTKSAEFIPIDVVLKNKEDQF